MKVIIGVLQFMAVVSLLSLVVSFGVIGFSFIFDANCDFWVRISFLSAFIHFVSWFSASLMTELTKLS